MYIVIIETQNQKAKQYTENLNAKLQNSNQNSTTNWALNSKAQELRF